MLLDILHDLACYSLFAIYSRFSSIASSTGKKYPFLCLFEFTVSISICGGYKTLHTKSFCWLPPFYPGNRSVWVFDPRKVFSATSLAMSWFRVCWFSVLSAANKPQEKANSKWSTTASMAFICILMRNQQLFFGWFKGALFDCFLSWIPAIF